MKRKRLVQKSEIKGFTLMELLVVMAIIAILAAMLLPVLSQARQKAKHARWLGYKNNVRSYPSLVAYYTFEKGESDELKNKAVAHTNLNYAPEKMDGALHGATWILNGGRWVGKNTLEFNGSSDYVDCGTGNSFDVDYITVEAWVKFGGSLPFRVIASRDDGSNRNWALYQLSTTKLRFFVFVSGGWGGSSGDADFSPTVGVWYHLVGVKSATHNIIYIDGKEAKSIAHSGVMDKNPVSLKIGRGSYPGYFNGSIGEVAIYDRALSAIEIKDHYEMGRP